MDGGGHQGDDVVGDGGGLDAGQCPLPTAVCVIKGDVTVGVERFHKFADEKGVAAGFGVDEFGQGVGGRRGGVQGVGDVGGYVGQSERVEGDGVDGRAQGAHFFNGQPDGVVGRQFVVAVGADEQQMGGGQAAAAAGEQALQQVARRAIHPLPVIQKEHQRVAGLGKDADEVLEGEVEAGFGFGGGQVGHGPEPLRVRRLRADDQFQVGQHVYDDLRITAQSGQQFLTPGG